MVVERLTSFTFRGVVLPRLFLTAVFRLTCQGRARMRDLTVMPEQPVRVVVEKRPSGCGTWLAILILLGLAIEYWYVSLSLLVLLLTIVVIVNSQQRKKQAELARHRPGPRDPWLNEVAVALADLGLSEIARNTGAHLGGAPIDGDIGLQGKRFLVYVTLFSDQRRAREAELGLRAKPEVRDAIANGEIAIRMAGRIVFIANAQGGVVDEFRLDEVVRVVGRLALPPSLRPAPAPTGPTGGSADPDVLEQLRKLGELQKTGVLSEVEFEAKKAELLGRL
jgi:hypothetical protein